VVVSGSASSRQQLLEVATPAGLAWKASGGEFVVPPHVALLNRALVRLSQRQSRRVVVSLPPRHGKSSLCSHFFPAWYLATHPDESVLLASYEAEFAASWGRKARDTMQEWGEQLFGLKVNMDTSAANRWTISGHRGGMFTAGVGGPLTGRGADVLIIDDPIKNPEEGNSLTLREKMWDWYTSTAYTRLEPNGVVILIMTRWHQDDLVGRILESNRTGGEEWDVIELPAICEDTDDPLGRKIGDPLWPERYPVQVLDRIRETLGAYWWGSLYQQRPSPIGGALLKAQWWESFDLNEAIEKGRSKFTSIIQSWDTAFSKNTTSDFSACVTMAEGPDGYYVLDVWRERVEFPELLRMAKILFEKWSPEKVLVEDMASGKSLIQALERDTLLPVVKVQPDKDKVSRTHSITGVVESGRVKLPESAPWLVSFLDECGQFPQGAHDDMVDAFVYGLLQLREGPGYGIW
jgi:predicted phage terminase large subunit-like protein